MSSARDQVAHLGAAITDLVYPRTCVACGKRPPPDRNLDLCHPCRTGLTKVEPPFCGACGESFPASADSATFRCSNCTGHRFGFAFAIAGYENSGPARDLVHRLKYGKQLHLRATLAGLLETTLADPRIAEHGGERGWLLVPVPLHPLKKFLRGFNQSDEIARSLAKRSGLRYAAPLRRVRWTKSQARLDRRHRLANLDRSMEVARAARRKNLVAGEHILLVDDVLTTGATTSACARALTEGGGAEKVAVITVARG